MVAPLTWKAWKLRARGIQFRLSQCRVVAWMAFCMVAIALLSLASIAADTIEWSATQLHAHSKSHHQLNSALPEFGFIMTRCVRLPVHNELWRENYRCLRRHFPTTPILIIDDYSDLTLVDQHFPMTNAAILYSDLPPGKGEILPYYYFYHRRPFRKAVMLNDGMLLQRREPLWSAIQHTSDFTCLWNFDEFRDNELEEQLHLISALKADIQGRLRALRLDMNRWTGCFSSASIMSWEFVARIHKAYGLLDMVSAIQTRADRMGLERVLGLIAADSHGTSARSQHEDTISVFGSIIQHRKTGSYSWQDYMQDKARGSITEPIIKIWNGRR
jgi:hypothetical protein